MIIEVRQIKANLKKEFDIYYDGKLQYTGKQTGLSSRNPSWLLNQDESVRFMSRENKKAYWRNRLMSWLFNLVALFAWLGTGRFLYAVLAGVIFCFLYSWFPHATKVCDIFIGSEEKVARSLHIGGLDKVYPFYRTRRRERRTLLCFLIIFQNSTKGRYAFITA